jgi:hypothetical protein
VPADEQSGAKNDKQPVIKKYKQDSLNVVGGNKNNKNNKSKKRTQ